MDAAPAMSGDASETLQEYADHDLDDLPTHVLEGSRRGSNLPPEEKFSRDCLEPQPCRNRKYYWVKTEEQHEQDPIEVDTVVKDFGVPQHVIMHHVQEEINEEVAVKSLPSALILVLLYALMSLAHDTQSSVRSVEEALTFDITENGNFAFSGYMGFKNRHDVGSYADFWSWMNKGMSQLFFLDQRWVSEDSGLDLGNYTAEEKSYYLIHNRKVAPLLLMQEEVAEVECTNTDMSDKFKLRCHEDQALDLTLDPTAFDIAQIDFSEAKNKTIFLTLDTYKETLEKLEKERWLNHRTYRVVVKMITYNANVDLLTVTSVHFMFSRSGHIWKEITNRSFKLEQYDSWEVYLWDILFYLHITYLFVQEVSELMTMGRRRKWRIRKCLSHYIGFWNSVDWLSILYAYVMLIIWFSRYAKVLGLKDIMLQHPSRVEACSNAADPAGCVTDEDYNFFTSAERAGAWIKDSNLLGAFYPLIIMLRLFKAFSAQPRLALVAMTLKNSAGNLAHFAIVFFSAFFSFVFTGIALFGQEIADFSQVDRCTMTLFRMLMGDFDYEALAANDRIVAALFVGVFQITMFLVLLNMLVAIVMDDYSETKHHLLHGETLWEEAYQICERAYENYKGIRIPLAKIKERMIVSQGVVCLKAKRTMTTEEFMAAVKDMPEAQANALLKSACEEWGETHKESVTMPQLLSSASVAVAFARALRGSIKQKSNMRPGSTAPAAANAVAVSEGMATEASERPRAPTLDEIAADDSVTLQDLLKAAELRLEADICRYKDPQQVKSLAGIIQSLQVLASTQDSQGDVAAKVKSHGVKV